MSQSHEDCLAYLEQLRWQGRPQCPYCNSTNATPVPKEKRYHCNECYNSYSVLVNTLFHKTHLSLDIWFRAISLVLISKNRVSVRQLARMINVNKNTAASMITRIEREQLANPELLKNIAIFCKEWNKDQ